MKIVYWTAGMLNIGLAALRVCIPKTLIIKKMALMADADELYPLATAGEALGGVVAILAFIPSHWPNKTIAAPKHVMI